jgi:hypothetical protein
LFKDSHEQNVALSFEIKFQNSLTREVSFAEYVVRLPLGFTGTDEGPYYQIMRDGEGVLASLEFASVPAHAGRTVRISGYSYSESDYQTTTLAQGCPEPLVNDCSPEGSIEGDDFRDAALSDVVLRDLKNYFHDIQDSEAGVFRLALADNVSEQTYQPELVLFTKLDEGGWESSKPGQWLPVHIFNNLNIPTSSLRFVDGYGLEITEINLTVEPAK